MKRPLVLIASATLAALLIYWTVDGDPPRAEAQLGVRPEPARRAEQPADPAIKPRPKAAAPVLEAAPASKSEKVIDGAWGSGPGQFGRKIAEESNAEAPMSIVAGEGGELVVVDQVNLRVQRFRDGKMVSSISASETVQDVALGPAGKTVLLDRLADQKVQVFDADGKLINEAPIVGKGLKEGG